MLEERRMLQTSIAHSAHAFLRRIPTSERMLTIDRSIDRSGYCGDSDTNCYVVSH
jgi:hypothetical protein